MDVRRVSEAGTERCDPARLPDLLAEDDGFVWVDLPLGDPSIERVLTDVFAFHPRAVLDCLQRIQVPKVHVYADSAFVVLHAPQPGDRGHVHYVEIDQFVGERYLVTVHGPVNPAVAASSTRVEVDAVAARLDDGRFRPASPAELSTAIVSALTARMRDLLVELTKDVWAFEQQVTGGPMGDAETFLDGMFRVRHGLLAVRTMAALSHEVYGRMHALAVFGDQGQRLLENSLDQFQRLTTMAMSQEAYLHGVIDFYQTRTTTKMTIAAERLAVIAAITLPVTALSSVLGMNVIVNSSTHWGALWVLIVVMAGMSGVLLLWTRRQGWW